MITCSATLRLLTRYDRAYDEMIEEADGGYFDVDDVAGPVAKLETLAHAIVAAGHTTACWVVRQRKPQADDHCECLVKQAQAALGETNA